jgi:hypothetical protein
LLGRVRRAHPTTTILRTAAITRTARRRMRVAYPPYRGQARTRMLEQVGWISPQGASTDNDPARGCDYAHSKSADARCLSALQGQARTPDARTSRVDKPAGRIHRQPSCARLRLRAQQDGGCALLIRPTGASAHPDARTSRVDKSAGRIPPTTLLRTAAITRTASRRMRVAYPPYRGSAHPDVRTSRVDKPAGRIHRQPSCARLRMRAQQDGGCALLIRPTGAARTRMFEQVGWIRPQGASTDNDLAHGWDYAHSKSADARLRKL